MAEEIIIQRYKIQDTQNAGFHRLKNFLKSEGVSIATNPRWGIQTDAEWKHFECHESMWKTLAIRRIKKELSIRMHLNWIELKAYKDLTLNQHIDLGVIIKRWGFCGWASAMSGTLTSGTLITVPRGKFAWPPTEP